MTKPVLVTIALIGLAALCFLGYRALPKEEDNGYFVYEGSIIKSEFPLQENQVEYAAYLYQTIYENHLEGMNVYMSIIPDKAYFASSIKHETLDYKKLADLMQSGFSSAQYIDISGLLTLEDYYISDSHWKQENIVPVAQAIAGAMGARVCSLEDYASSSVTEFFGAYYDQVSKKVDADELVFLTSGYTESSVLTGYGIEGETSLYTLGNNGYDIFLGGAQPILDITCPNANSTKELVIFRDSFGSSLAPLFAGAYSKITLVDLRYFSSKLLEEFISFENQDILFISSTSLLNNGMIMK